MTAPTITLEALIRARAALEAAYRHRIGEPWPMALALQVADAKGYFCSQVAHIAERQPVEVTEVQP